MKRVHSRGRGGGGHRFYYVGVVLCIIMKGWQLKLQGIRIETYEDNQGGNCPGGGGGGVIVSPVIGRGDCPGDNSP